MLTYILEVSICWGVFYLLYALLLSKETFFTFNRWYLLSTFVLSLIIPKVDWRLPEPVVESEIATVYFQPITVGMETLEVTVTAAPVTSGIQFADVLWWIYLAGVAFFTLRFFIGLWQINRLYQHGEKRWTAFYELVLSQKIHQPFSFFDRLFLSKNIPLSPEEERQIVQHELAHIRGLHSVDVVLLEIIGILFWCTPLVYYYRKSLCNVHEYIADAVVLRTNKKKQYGHLLIRQSQSGPQIALANHFHSQLKKRILMMMRNKSKRQAMLKYLLAIPLTLGVMLLFSNADAQEGLQKQAEALEQAISSVTTISSDAMKINHENGILYFESEEGVTIKTDTIPWGSSSAKSTEEQPTFEIIFQDGTSKILTSGEQINDQIQPEQIEKIEVLKPENLVKIWIKKEDSVSLREEISKVSVTVKGAETKSYEDYDIELIYKNGKIIRFKNASSEEVFETINPKDISKIEVIKKQENLIRVWLKIKYKEEKKADVDEMPIFPGCEGITDADELRKCSDKKLLTFIYRQIKYPQEARNAGIQGTVVVKYQIDEQGFVSFAQIHQGIGGGCDEEVLRILKEMPRWTPAKKDGKAVAVEMVLPVKYKLEGEDDETSNERTYLNGDDQPLEYSKDQVLHVIGYGEAKKAVTNDEVFKTVEQMPRFPAECPEAKSDAELKQCADRAMLEFIYKNIKYPKVARDNNTQGTVVVSFIVEKDGSISNAKAVRDIGDGCGEEALRVVQLMQQQNMRWTPGTQKGKPVRVQFNLPIRFSLEGTDASKPETKTTPMNDEIFKVVDQMPRFPAECPDAKSDAELKQCADRAMLEFIYKNIKYPQAARDAKTEGMVVVSFIVEKDGSISNAKSVRDIGDGCGAEALRVVQLMQEQNMRWAPGMQNGKSVRVQFMLPIRFKLESADDSKPETAAPIVPPVIILQLDDFRATPNPTKGLLNLSFRAEAKPTIVKIFDASGKEIHSETLQNFTGNYQEEFDFSNLPKGILNILVMQDKKAFMSKVVLQ